MFGGPIVATYLLGLRDLYQSEPTGKLYVGEAVRPGADHFANIVITTGRLTTRVTKFHQYMWRQCKHAGPRNVCGGVCQDNWLEYASSGMHVRCGEPEWARFRSRLPDYLARSGLNLGEQSLIVDAVTPAPSVDAATKRLSSAGKSALLKVAPSLGRLQTLALQATTSGTFAYQPEYPQGDTHMYKRRAPVPHSLCPVNAIPPTPKVVNALHRAALELTREATTPLAGPLGNAAELEQVRRWIKGQCSSHEQLAQADEHGRAAQCVLSPWNHLTLPTRSSDALHALGTGYFAAMHAIFFARCASDAVPLRKGDVVSVKVADPIHAMPKSILTRGVGKGQVLVCICWTLGEAVPRVVVVKSAQSVVAIEESGGVEGALHSTASGETEPMARLWPTSSILAVYARESRKDGTGIARALQRVQSIAREGLTANTHNTEVLAQFEQRPGVCEGTVLRMPTEDGSVCVQLTPKAAPGVRLITRARPEQGQLVSFTCEGVTPTKLATIKRAWQLDWQSGESESLPYLLGVVERATAVATHHVLIRVVWGTYEGVAMVPTISTRPDAPRVEIETDTLVCAMDLRAHTNEVTSVALPRAYNDQLLQHHTTRATRLMKRVSMGSRMKSLAWVQREGGERTLCLVSLDGRAWKATPCEYVASRKVVVVIESESATVVSNDAIVRVAQPYEWAARDAGRKAARLGGIATCLGFGSRGRTLNNCVSFCIDALERVREQYVSVSGVLDLGGPSPAEARLELVVAGRRDKRWPTKKWLNAASGLIEAEVSVRRGVEAANADFMPASGNAEEEEQRTSSDEDEGDEEATPCSSLIAPQVEPFSAPLQAEGQRDKREDSAERGGQASLHTRGRAQRRLQHMCNLDDLAQGRHQAQNRRDRAIAEQATQQGEVAPYHSQVHGKKGNEEQLRDGEAGHHELAAHRLQLLQDCRNGTNQAKRRIFESMLSRTGLLSAHPVSRGEAPRRCHVVRCATRLDTKVGRLAVGVQAALAAGVAAARAAPTTSTRQGGLATASAHVIAPRTTVSKYMADMERRGHKPIKHATEQAAAVRAVLREFMRCNACRTDLSETPQLCHVGEGRVCCQKLECRQAATRGCKTMQVIAGSPGVGKSEVLLAIQAYLHLNGWGYALLILSHTGAAVSRVGGLTIDSVTSACKRGVPDESLGRTKTGKIKSKLQYNKQLCEAIWGHIVLVLVDEAWTASSTQVAALHRLFLARSGGPASLYFGGVQMVFFGDPIQLGPHGSAMPLLPPDEDQATNAEPGAGGREYGQWLFANAPQQVFVLFE